MVNKSIRMGLAGLAALALTLGSTPAFAYDGPTSWSTAGLKNVYTETGALSWSVDGIGLLADLGTDSGTLRVNKPAGGTVHKAFFIAAQVQESDKPTLGSASPIQLNGSPVTFSLESLNASGDDGNAFNNYWADVTDLVSTTLNAAATGQSTVTVDEAGVQAEGEALIVVWNDPAVDTATIFLNFGNSDPAGDNFALAFPALTAPQLEDLQMSVGISYSYQTPTDGPGDATQASNITVNDQPLADTAGGYDDCLVTDINLTHDDCMDGALMTIGGVGDSLNNPTLPTTDPIGAQPDDELYSLACFVQVGSTQIAVQTRNASANDNIFFAGFDLKHIVATDLNHPASTAAAPALPSTGVDAAATGMLGAAAALAALIGAIVVTSVRRKENA